MQDLILHHYATSPFSEYTRIGNWFERVQAFGHGEHESMSSDDAIGIAKAAHRGAPLAFDAQHGFVFGDAVQVTPIDYAQDPVAGRLCGLGDDEVAIERDDERAGRVVVHFPRIGFQIRKSEP